MDELECLVEDKGGSEKVIGCQFLDGVQIPTMGSQYSSSSKERWEDYQDLNRAIPKDDFPLPHIDILVDNTTRHTCFHSWMVFRAITK
ncbi:hypothetical protein CR513_19154, partial [Mucuna pruriens]